MFVDPETFEILLHHDGTEDIKPDVSLVLVPFDVNTGELCSELSRGRYLKSVDLRDEEEKCGVKKSTSSSKKALESYSINELKKDFTYAVLVEGSNLAEFSWLQIVVKRNGETIALVTPYGFSDINPPFNTKVREM